MTTLDRADLLAICARCGGAELYSGNDGSIVRLENELHTDITDGTRLCALLDELNIRSAEICTVKSRDAADALKKRFGFRGEQPCSQWVYTAKEPPRQIQGVDIRILRAEDIELAASHYHNEVEYFRYCVEHECIWGLYEGESLAGFIGLHEQGSMGMLEILPAFRRRGYGYALEARLIALHLERGWLPYCHVVEGNNASLALQAKLGLQCAETPTIWVY